MFAGIMKLARKAKKALHDIISGEAEHGPEEQRTRFLAPSGTHEEA